MTNNINSNEPIIVTSESSIEAGEEHKNFKRFKKKFFQFVKKSPELKHMNPEDLWNDIDKTQLYRFPYQRIREKRYKP